MTESSRGYQQFFAEMKRRRVFRVMAMYGIIGFGIIEAAEAIFPRVALPDWAVTLVVWLTLLGFPIAVLLAWAFDSTPEGMKRTGDAAPGEIDAILAQPASRRWSAGLLGLAGVVLLFGGWWMGRQTAPETGDVVQANLISGLQLADLSEDVRPSIAVLPFVNMSSDEEQEYFSDGMTEEVINTLVGIHDLRVAGRTSAFAYKGENKDLREIGAELGVDYLVEGSVRKDGDQLRITAQLIDAGDGSHLWSDSYTRPEANIFDIQIEIAEAIATALKVPLGLQESHDLVTPTADLEAYDLYLAGRAKLRLRGTSLLDAIEFFEAAVARDSSFAPAWASLAEAKEVRVWYPDSFEGGVRTPKLIEASIDQSEQAARRALDLDPRNASALVALGSVLRDRGEWADSDASYKEAIALDPDNAEAQHQYAEFLSNVGRIAEAVRAADRAAVLDPAPIRLRSLGRALMLDDRTPEASEVLRLGITQDPRATQPAMWSDAIYASMKTGDLEGAVDLGDLFIQTVESVTAGTLIEDELGASTRPGRARIETYVAAIASGRVERISGMPADARIWMIVGEPDSAVAQVAGNPLIGGLEGVSLIWMLPFWYPELDAVRSDPRVQRVLQARGLGDVRVQRTIPSERTRPMILGRAP